MSGKSWSSRTWTKEETGQGKWRDARTWEKPGQDTWTEEPRHWQDHWQNAWTEETGQWRDARTWGESGQGQWRDARTWGESGQGQERDAADVEDQGQERDAADEEEDQMPGGQPLSGAETERVHELKMTMPSALTLIIAALVGFGISGKGKTDKLSDYADALKKSFVRGSIAQMARMTFLSVPNIIRACITDRSLEAIKQNLQSEVTFSLLVEYISALFQDAFIGGSKASQFLLMEYAFRLKDPLNETKNIKGKKTQLMSLDQFVKDLAENAKNSLIKFLEFPDGKLDTNILSSFEKRHQFLPGGEGLRDSKPLQIFKSLIAAAFSVVTICFNTESNDWKWVLETKKDQGMDRTVAPHLIGLTKFFTTESVNAFGKKHRKILEKISVWEVFSNDDDGESAHEDDINPAEDEDDNRSVCSVRSVSSMCSVATAHTDFDPESFTKGIENALKEIKSKQLKEAVEARLAHQAEEANRQAEAEAARRTGLRLPRPDTQCHVAGLGFQMPRDR